MKAEEIKKCGFCNRGLMHAGHPMFYHITCQTMGVDLRAVQKQHGLEQIFGGGPGAPVALARLFSPDPDVAKPIGAPVDSLICMECALKPQVMALLAQPDEKEDDDEAKSGS